MQRKSLANSPIDSEEKRQVRSKLVCPYLNCVKAYNKPCLLRNHILSHADVKPFACPEAGCDKRYLRLCHLLRHRASHDSKISDGSPKQRKRTNGINESTFCEKQSDRETVPNKLNRNYTDSNEINISSLTNNGSCKHVREAKQSTDNNTSDKATSNSIIISRRSTGGDEGDTTELICPKCQRDFSNLSNLKQHLPLHDETRVLFACTHSGCGKAYARKSNLRVHVMTSHDGISRFQCTYPGCTKIFKFNSTLKKHSAKHNNPVEQKKPRRYMRPLASQISGYRTLLLSQDVP